MNNYARILILILVRLGKFFPEEIILVRFGTDAQDNDYDDVGLKRLQLEPVRVSCYFQIKNQAKELWSIRKTAQYLFDQARSRPSNYSSPFALRSNFLKAFEGPFRAFVLEQKGVEQAIGDYRSKLAALISLEG